MTVLHMFKLKSKCACCCLKSHWSRRWTDQQNTTGFWLQGPDCSWWLVLFLYLLNRHNVFSHYSWIDISFHINSQTVQDFPKELFLWQGHQMPYSKLVFIFTSLNSHRQFGFCSCLLWDEIAASVTGNNTLKLLQRWGIISQTMELIMKWLRLNLEIG